MVQRSTLLQDLILLSFGHRFLEKFVAGIIVVCKDASKVLLMFLKVLTQKNLNSAAIFDSKVGDTSQTELCH